MIPLIEKRIISDPDTTKIGMHRENFQVTEPEKVDVPIITLNNTSEINSGETHHVDIPKYLPKEDEILKASERNMCSEVGNKYGYCMSASSTDATDDVYLPIFRGYGIDKVIGECSGTITRDKNRCQMRYDNMKAKQYNQPENIVSDGKINDFGWCPLEQGYAVPISNVDASGRPKPKYMKSQMGSDAIECVKDSKNRTVRANQMDDSCAVHGEGSFECNDYHYRLNGGADQGLLNPMNLPVEGFANNRGYMPKTCTCRKSCGCKHASDAKSNIFMSLFSSLMGVIHKIMGMFNGIVIGKWREGFVTQPKRSDYEEVRSIIERVHNYNGGEKVATWDEYDGAWRGFYGNNNVGQIGSNEYTKLNPEEIERRGVNPFSQMPISWYQSVFISESCTADGDLYPTDYKKVLELMGGKNTSVSLNDYRLKVKDLVTNANNMIDDSNRKELQKRDELVKKCYGRNIHNGLYYISNKKPGIIRTEYDNTGYRNVSGTRESGIAIDMKSKGSKVVSDFDVPRMKPKQTFVFDGYIGYPENAYRAIYYVKNDNSIRFMINNQTYYYKNQFRHKFLQTNPIVLEGRSLHAVRLEVSNFAGPGDLFIKRQLFNIKGEQIDEDGKVTNTNKAKEISRKHIYH